MGPRDDRLRSMPAAVGERLTQHARLRAENVRLLSALVVAALLAGGLQAFSGGLQAGQKENDGPDLKAVLLFGWRMPDAGFPSLPASLKPAVLKYWQRQERFHSRLAPPKSDDWVVRQVFEKHLHAERTVWSLFDVPDIGRLAADFASKVGLAYEWEGFSDGPLAEAASGERYLRAHPNTRLASFVRLFIGHRYLCAVPLLEFEKKRARQADAAKRARAELALAATSNQPLVRFLALRLKADPRCFSEF